MTSKPHDWHDGFSVLTDFWSATPAPHGSEDALQLADAVRRARKGSRSGLALALALLKSEDAFVSRNSYIYAGEFSTEPEIIDLLLQYRAPLRGAHDWWTRVRVIEMLFHTRLPWATPIMIELFHRMCMQDSLREIDMPRIWIQTLLCRSTDELPQPKERETYWNREHFTIEAWFMLEGWRQVCARVGDLRTAILYGRPFDAQMLAKATLDERALQRRWVYESVTGVNCSNWYRDGQPQPLQIRGEVERFLAEDAHRYKPGHRYFLGQEVPKVADPRALELMQEAIDYLEAQLQTVKREYLITAGIVEDDADDEDAPGWDDYTYAGLDDWRADPNGTAWDRVAAAAQDAALGEFHRLVDNVVDAAQLETESDDFDLLAARLLGDAGPSEQLRRLVSLADERPEPRWRELCLIALAGSGLGWALEAAGALMCGLEPSTARFGEPWLHLWRRLRPKVDIQDFKLLRARERGPIQAWIRERTAAHDPDTVLWAGEPLHLPTLVALLERSVAKQPSAPAEVAALRHLLQTMTGVELAAIWATPETVDPLAARARIDALRAEPSVQRHAAGTRLFFATPVPTR